MRNFYSGIIRCCVAAVLSISTAANFVNAQQSTTNNATSAQKANAEQLVLTITVTDHTGRYVGGLDQSAFSVLDNSLPQKITYFRAIDVPISVAILLDVSGSMAMALDSNRLLGIDERNVKLAIREGLVDFMRFSNTANQYLLLGFNEQTTLLTDWTEKPENILDMIPSLKLKGKSALFDACFAALEKLSHSKYQKKVVLIISDGEDNSSKRKLSEIRRSLMSSNVLIYGVSLIPPLEGVGRDSRVEELAQLSGGISLFARGYRESSPLFALVAQELRHQYSVGFTPLNSSGKSEWHKLQVNVTFLSSNTGKPKNLVARTRKGYTTF